MMKKRTELFLFFAGCLLIVFLLLFGKGPFEMLHHEPLTKIHALQGNGMITPEQGKRHTIEGIVIGDFQGNDHLNGFFVQAEERDMDHDPLTSEGIFVYAPHSRDVNVGDVVRLTGKVEEFHGSTELKQISNLRILRRNVTLPPATDILLPFNSSDFPERYEGMLVTFPQVLTVTDTYELGQYGSLTLASGGRLMKPTNLTPPGAEARHLQAVNALNRIILDDGSRRRIPATIPYPLGGLSASQTLRVGDAISNLTGVLEYSFDHYRVHPTTPPVCAATNPRPSVPPPINGALKIAAFNVQNYFTSLAKGVNTGRGANSEIELHRQREKLIAAIVVLDADIVGLMEIENNDRRAIQNLVDGLNQVTGEETYAYLETGKMGGDLIRIGIVYQPKAVKPVGDFRVDTDPIFTRPPLAQTFEDAAGERMTVVVNHFKSKRCEQAAGADREQGDGQDCYNATRIRQTQSLLEFIETVVIPISGDPDVLILGDLNAYAKEDPITTLERAGYRNLIAQFVGVSAYSYVFQGESGYLGHALASRSLAEQVTGAAIWHINADEPRVLDYNEEDKSPEQRERLYQADPYRSSDHDPLLIGLTLRKTAAENFP